LANLRRRIALLDYSSLLDPTRYEKNRLLKAEVVFRYRNRELAVARELYQHGSVSKVMYLRAIAARDIAESNLKAIQSATETQRKFQLIQAARSRLNVAEQEFAIAKRLFASNSISLQAMDRATSNLKIATAELESSKESLGARAIQVRQ
jgi:multidrug resistance efflux pump